MAALEKIGIEHAYFNEQWETHTNLDSIERQHYPETNSSFFYRVFLRFATPHKNDKNRKALIGCVS